jgi:dynactin-4
MLCLEMSGMKVRLIIIATLRCANCFECPSCGNALSARASAVAIPSENPEEKATAKKVFFLSCGFCRWSTRDVAIPDRNNGMII